MPKTTLNPNPLGFYTPVLFYMRLLGSFFALNPNLNPNSDFLLDFLDIP